MEIEGLLMGVQDEYEEREEERGFLEEDEVEGYVRRVKAVAERMAAMVVKKEKLVIEMEMEGYEKEPTVIELKEMGEVRMLLGEIVD